MDGDSPNDESPSALLALVLVISPENPSIQATPIPITLQC